VVKGCKPADIALVAETTALLALIGLSIVVAAVFGGYLLGHGEPALLYQPPEFLIIWGAALGSIVISTPPSVLKRAAAGAKRALSPSPFSRALYLDTLKLYFDLFQRSRKLGMMALEKDVERPLESEVFANRRLFMRDRSAVRFVCDTLRVAISGGVGAFDLDQLAESDIEARRSFNRRPIDSLFAVADALPGLGIVAAVLGIVIAMSALGGPPEELGRKVAAALVGTFLGVLSSYGFVSPVASAMEAREEEELSYYEALRAGLVAFVKGNPPIMAVEFARRVIPQDVRPTFGEMELYIKGGR